MTPLAYLRNEQVADLKEFRFAQQHAGQNLVRGRNDAALVGTRLFDDDYPMLRQFPSRLGTDLTQ